MKIFNVKRHRLFLPLLISIALIVTASIVSFAAQVGDYTVTVSSMLEGDSTQTGIVNLTEPVVEGNNITVTAPLNVGDYCFDGWYTYTNTEETGILISEEPVSNNNEYTFEVTANTDLYAVYSVVPSGGFLDIKVEGNNTQIICPETISEISFGDLVTVKCSDEDNFWYWKDESGNVLSISAEYSFYARKSMTVTAVMKGSGTQVVFENKYGLVIKTELYQKKQGIEPPEIPSYRGCQPLGWKDKNEESNNPIEEINTFLSSYEGTSVTFEPVYEERNTDVEHYSIDIVQYDKISKESFADTYRVGGVDKFALGTTTNVKANLKYKNNDFSYWSLDGGVTAVSVNRTYKVRTQQAGSVRLTAVYGDSSQIEINPSVSITDYTETSESPKYRLTNTLQYNVPTGYTDVDAGFVYSVSKGYKSNPDLLTIGAYGSADVSSKTDTSSGLFTLNLSTSSATKELYIRAYLQYKDDTDGDLVTIYSAMNTQSYEINSPQKSVEQVTLQDSKTTKPTDLYVRAGIQSPVNATARVPAETLVDTGTSGTTGDTTNLRLIVQADTVEDTSNLKGKDASEIMTEKLKDEALSKALDISVVGVQQYNTEPIVTTLKNLLPKNLKKVEIYHCHDESKIKMTSVSKADELTDDNTFDNTFYYNSNTGDVTIAVTNFSNFTFNYLGEQYNIAYEPNGGSNPGNPTTYRVGKGVAQFADSTKNGYTFAGWFDGNRRVKSIGPEQIGDIKLDAHWTANKYQVTFNGNGSDSEYSEIMEETYGDNYELPEINPTRTGYTFGGWFTAPEGGEPVYTDTTVSITGEQILYAHWIENPKFTTVFENTDNCLYRVGNDNPVTLSQLFEIDTEDAEISDVSIKVEAVEDNSTVKGSIDNNNLAEGSTAKCVYTENANDWTSGTLKFSGEGPVKVTIAAEDCEPYTLNLEIVNGQNVTTATSATTKNIILLNDVSTNSLTVSGGYALYGNGFEVRDTRTSPTAENNQNGYVTINNGTVDNIQFIGYEPTEQNLFNTGHTDIAPAVKVGTGGANIYNCYISGGRYALQADTCNIIMEGTTLDGGAIGNAYLTGGNITMTNCVTTISTRGGMKGLGICIPSVSGVKLNLKGTFEQHNWATSSEVPSALSGLIRDVYSNSTFAASKGGNTYVNTGIFFLDVAGGSISATEAQKAINDATGNEYTYFEKSASSMTGCCYTAKATMFSEAMLAKPIFTPVNYATVPAVSFDHTKNYKAYSATESYCIEEGGVENIQVVKRAKDDAFEWDPYIMTISDKYGNALSYTVKLNGTEYAQGSKIKFDTAGDNNVEYIYTDPYNFDKDVQKSGKEYTQIQKVHVTTLADYHPQFSYVGNWQADAKQVVANDTVYIMPDVSATSAKFGSTTVGGQTIYYPIVDVTKSGSSSISFWAPAFSAINIKDLNGNNGTTKYTYSSSSQNWPHGQKSGVNYSGVNKQPSDTTAFYGYIVTSSAANSPWHSAGVYANGNNGNASTTYDKNNGGLCFYSSGLSAPRKEGNQLVQFWYRGDDGIVYRYYIQYHFPETKYTVEINCGSGGTVDKSSVSVSYKDSLTADGNKLKNGSTVVATATPNPGYAAKWSNLPSSVTSNKTGNSAVKLIFVKDCTITINCGEGGTVSPATVSGVATGAKITAKGNQLLRDGNVIATAKPSSSDYIAEWNIPNATVEDDMTVGLTFVKAVTITITAGSNGSVSPTSVKVAPGKKLTASGTDLKYDGVTIATAKPNSKYEVDKWSGVPTGAINADTSVNVSFKQSGCFTPDTMITMADGTKMPIEHVDSGDSVLSWDFYSGECVETPVVAVTNHGTDTYNQISLGFSNGSNVDVLETHDFFCCEKNSFVEINASNYESYIGYSFVTINDEGVLGTAELVSADLSVVSTDAYSIFTAKNVNAIAEGMLSLSPSARFLVPFEVGEGMKYDENQMNADIEKYKLMSYAEFLDVFKNDIISKSVYDALGAQYMRIAIGKGIATMDDIIEYANILANDTI